MAAFENAEAIRPAVSRSEATSWRLAAYSLFALPLTMAALPLYVLVPSFYAGSGLALTTIAAVLLGTRLLDAVTDPLLGAWVDRARGKFLRPVLAAVPLLVAGFVLLFAPPAALSATGTALWLVATLVAATLGYSLASIAYQAWGARLADDDAGRARVTAWRESFGLVGVIVASLVAAVSTNALAAIFVIAVAVGIAALAHVARTTSTAQASASQPRAAAPLIGTLSAPLAQPRFRWLLAVFVTNGIAAAIPAALVLFFIADRLQQPEQSGRLLALYFVAAAAGMPLWARLARRFGLHATWLAGIGLAIAAFIWAYATGPGDLVPFALICALSGLALGADLALPPALLARVIALNGHSGEREGAYFGLWNFANKLNLALAAGLALPALDALGYAPGARDEVALDALAAAYALLPCALKLVAGLLLFTAWRRHRC